MPKNDATRKSINSEYEGKYQKMAIRMKSQGTVIFSSLPALKPQTCITYNYLFEK